MLKPTPSWTVRSCWYSGASQRARQQSRRACGLGRAAAVEFRSSDQPPTARAGQPAETYGSIRYTIGAGCSGGSIQQYVIAADYPGLLDGIKPNCSFQDSWTTANEVNDCHLLRHYFNTTGGFTPAE